MVCVCVREMRGKAAPVQAAPMESTKREEERRCVFTRLGFWGGERHARRDRVARATRKSESEVEPESQSIVEH